MKEKIAWKNVIVDSLLIVLSVLFALFINEWNTERNQRNETTKMMENIQTEITQNQVLLDSLIPYHESVLLNIQQAAMADSIESTFFSSGYFEINAVAPKGIIQGNLQRIAWTIAQEENITNRISYQKSQILFSTYEQQQRVLRTIERIIDILSSREIHRKELLDESLIVLAIEWNEMIAQEHELNRIYTHTLERLNESD
ncbi:hypothetical protein [Balneola vulgaris]|uniref:hypothetical protein n=1 Tax=Balneola vulgaris TaxID=287535 RepID=UPI0003803C99|nr:hypothetical protein [Balneola vulgaris]